MDDIPCASHSNKVRNYAEATPYQLQAELDDASVVSEDPKYGCDADCLYCGQPCVRSKFGHVFISVVSITAGGECTNPEFVCFAINRLKNVGSAGAIID